MKYVLLILCSLFIVDFVLAQKKMFIQTKKEQNQTIIYQSSKIKNKKYLYDGFYKVYNYNKELLVLGTYFENNKKGNWYFISNNKLDSILHYENNSLNASSFYFYDTFYVKKSFCNNKITDIITVSDNRFHFDIPLPLSVDDTMYYFPTTLRNFIYTDTTQFRKYKMVYERTEVMPRLKNDIGNDFDFSYTKTLPIMTYANSLFDFNNCLNLNCTETVYGYINFVILEDGTTDDFKIVKDNCNCSNEMIRVAKLLELTPGKIKDEPVKCYYTIPFRKKP